ncbi:MAG: GTPase [Acidimicrobiia bacterium]
MTDVRELLDLHDRLVAACVDIVPTPLLESSAEVGRAARRRSGYLGETVVVALAGGTGSGKSSLLNALAGEEVSPPGARRPTTAEPMAWIPSNPEPGLTRLLDDIGVVRRVGQDEYPWLAVIDLPDTDSVVIDHRQTVDRLLPLVDAVVWVLDPEKYQDARLHRDHLRPLASRADRFVFALNQVDRVDPAVRGELAADLRESLVADGIRDPRILLTAGDPPNGLQIGIHELVDAIRALGSTASVVSARIVDELVASADRLVEPVGGLSGTGFVERWAEARNQVAQTVAEAVDVELRRQARSVAADDARAVSAWFGSRDVASDVVATGAQVSSAASEPLRRLVTDIGGQLDPQSKAEIAKIGNALDDEVAGSALTIGATVTVALEEPPAWWSWIRLLSYAMVAVAGIGLALAVDAWRSDTSFGIAPVLIGVGGIGRGALRMAVRRSALARTDRAMAGRRDESAMLVSAELERRIGRPIRTTLRARSAPGAAHTELMLAIRRYEEREN